jgi:iron complex outermembrane receptor protein
MKTRSLATMLATSVCLVAVATPAHAQSRSYAIPAGSLKAALDAYGRQSGRQIIYKADDIRGARSGGVRGSLSAAVALATLLRGSGFTYRNDASGAVAIVAGEGEAGSVAADSEDAEIIVTGSRIKGSQPVAPVIVAKRETIEAFGYTDLGSFVRSIPQNYSGGQNPGVVSGFQSGSENSNSSSTLNLRGLGPDATLTLLNGRRVAYDAVSQGIDITAIPLGAVERIEVVADGSSALYGSDAVGGVANILLRRDFDGLQTSVRLGGATEGGAFQQQYSAVAGARWDSGGFMIAGGFSRTTDIAAGQRSYTADVQPSLTLMPAQRQVSAVFSGHQQLGSVVEFAIDGHYDRRRSHVEIPYADTGDATTYGFVSRPAVESYSISPSITVSLPADWTLTTRATYALSDTRAPVEVFVDGASFFVNDVQYQNELWSAEVGIEGPLFSLPGGEARLAAGAGFRSNELDASIVRTLGGTTTELIGFTDHQTAKYGYGEISLPFVSDLNAMPGIRKLHLSGAVRYEDYGDMGGLATPKIGLIYQPVQDIAFKAAWGKSFKAPTLYQRNLVTTGAVYAASRYIPSPPDNRPVLQINGGNRDVGPERATTLTLTTELTPRIAPGLRLEASYFRINYKDRVAEPISFGSQSFSPAYADLILLNPSLDQVQAVIANLPRGVDNYSGGAYDPGNLSAIVFNQYQNVAEYRVKGVDMAAAYAFSGGASEFSLEANASYLETDQRLSAGQPLVARAGFIFNPPHWRGRLSAAWERGALSANFAYNYLGGTTDARTSTVYKVDDFQSVDVTLGWRPNGEGLLSGWSFLLSAQNLLNEKPSLIRTSDNVTPTYDATNYSSVGRLVSLTVTKRW